MGINCDTAFWQCIRRYKFDGISCNWRSIKVNTYKYRPIPIETYKTFQKQIWGAAHKSKMPPNILYLRQLLVMALQVEPNQFLESPAKRFSIFRHSFWAFVLSSNQVMISIGCLLFESADAKNICWGKDASLLGQPVKALTVLHTLNGWPYSHSNQEEGIRVFLTVDA